MYPNMLRALRIDCFQSSQRTATGGHVIAVPVSKLCGLTSNCTHACCCGTDGRCTEFTEIVSLWFHQTMPCTFTLSVSNCSSSDHCRNYSCPRRSRSPSPLCRVPRHWRNLVQPQNYPIFPRSPEHRWLCASWARRCLSALLSNSNVFPDSSARSATVRTTSD